MIEISEKFKTLDFGIQALSKLAIFATFTSEELGKIYNSGELRIYENGSNVVIEGETTTGIYLILDGMVGVYKNSKKIGNGNRLASLGPGKSFGEMSLIDKQPRSATVAADGDVVVYFLSGTAWEDIAQMHPEIAKKFFENTAKMLSARLRELDDDFVLSQKQLWKYVIARALHKSA